MNPEPNHQERAHAEFSPSQLKYLKQCAGYHGKDNDSDASQMGTRIHEALEIQDPSKLQSDKEHEIYEIALREENDLYVNAFGSVDDVTIIKEERMTIEIDAKSEMFGTADIVALRDDVALCADYKTGISMIDEPRDNWQARAYALGIFQKYESVNTVHFAFIIPQRNEVLVGSFTRSEDLEWLRSEISEVVRRAEITRPKWAAGAIDMDELSPNVNCRFCRHEDTCPALVGVCVEVAKRYKPDLIPDGTLHVSEINDPDHIAKLFIVAKIVEEWASHVKYKATTMAKEGVELKGLKLRSLGSRVSVKDPVGLLEDAMKRGLQLYDVLECSNISVSRLVDRLTADAARGTKTKIEQDYYSTLESTGVIEKTEVNYALTVVK
jgi:hypothetical protein